MAKRKRALSKRNGNEVASADKINRMHNLMRSDVKDVLCQKPKIVESSNVAFEVWREQQVGVVEFFMTSESRPVRVAPGRGGGIDRSRPVVELPRPSQSCRRLAPLEWGVAWFEKWNAQGASKFSFKHASWSLFCGVTLHEPVLVLRAEWHVPSSPDNAGQPHWHVHKVVELSGPVPDPRQQAPEQFGSFLSDEDESSPTSDLVLLEARPALVGASIERMHLAMAGWAHSNKFPQCWQHPVAEDVCDMLRRWSRASLQYLQSQLEYVSPVRSGNLPN